MIGKYSKDFPAQSSHDSGGGKPPPYNGVWRFLHLRFKNPVAHFFFSGCAVSLPFPAFSAYNGSTIYEGGLAMQCQKLKTYMETGRVVFLPAKSIRPNPAQPRKVFSPEALDELADSIRRHGILQPLSVRRVGTGYELIAGERRLRAAKLAGISDVPCILMNMDDRESGMAAMVENLQRQVNDSSNSISPATVGTPTLLP